MLDSQKLSFENFLMNYKHGCYIFSSDTCHACQDYKREIEWIDNCYLYFVEVTTEEEKNLLSKIIDRKAFPQTVGYVDNEIKFIRAGVIYESDWKEIQVFLDKFGTNPLPKDEIQRRIEKQKNRCLLTFYAIPENIQGDDRKKIINSAYKYNEMPIDIDAFCPDVDNKERERMLEGQYHFAKLVIWSGGTCSNFTNDIVVSYTINNQEVKFIKRDISEVIQ
jgi:hypothetical protein